MPYIWWSYWLSLVSAYSDALTEKWLISSWRSRLAEPYLKRHYWLPIVTCVFACFLTNNGWYHPSGLEWLMLFYSWLLSLADMDYGLSGWSLPTIYFFGSSVMKTARHRRGNSDQSNQDTRDDGKAFYRFRFRLTTHAVFVITVFVLTTRACGVLDNGTAQFQQSSFCLQKFGPSNRKHSNRLCLCNLIDVLWCYRRTFCLGRDTTGGCSIWGQGAKCFRFWCAIERDVRKGREMIRA
jgi:hypothetical protein